VSRRAAFAAVAACMTAPATPSSSAGLGPFAAGGEAPGGRRRVSSGPWQLVEVSNAKAAAVRSQPASPSIPLLHSPFDNDEIGMPAAAVDWADWAEEEGDTSQRLHGNTQQRPAKEEGFDPSYFVGDWLDNLGHKILVVPGNQPRGAARRRGGGGGGRLSFLATLSKAGVPDKRFNISKDRGKRDWTCGNGTLVRSESNMEVLVWNAADGRMSTWSRAPPEGPVYFDAAPAAVEQPACTSYFTREDVGHPSGTVYFDAPPEAHMVYFDPPPGTLQEHTGAVTGGFDGSWLESAPTAGPFYFVVQQQPMEWKELHLPADDDEGQGEQATSGPSSGSAAEAPSTATPAAVMLNPSAAEFVPAGILAESCETAKSQSPELGAVPAGDWPPLPSAAAAAAVAGTPPRRVRASPKEAAAASPPHRASWGRTPTPSPMMGPQPAPHGRRTPTPSPMLGPLPPPQEDSRQGLLPASAMSLGAPVPPVVEVLEESPEMHAEGSLLEWSLKEPWGLLSRYEKDFCLTSSMFSIRRCANMQLAFYPNGSRTAEAGQCTVALNRGPESAGIKFEFRVNGRSIGPKVCLGRRYLGDYPRPFDESEENRPSRVSICMQVLEILGVSD